VCEGETVDTEQLRATLRERERRLVDDIDRLTAPHQNTGSISFGKRVGDGTAMAVDRLSAVQAHDVLVTSLTEVRRALALLESGGYGRCEHCGEPIPEGRLEARPWATRCVRHA
jgi:RNA polymerase-binding transcription factor DksA